MCGDSNPANTEDTLLSPALLGPSPGHSPELFQVNVMYEREGWRRALDCGVIGIPSGCYPGNVGSNPASPAILRRKA